MRHGNAWRKTMFAEIARIALLGLAALAYAARLSAATLPAPPTESGGLNDRLAAGEFTAAIQHAANLDPVVRDAALEEIAAAQARAGGSSAAAATIASMRDDRLRSRSLELLGYVNGNDRSGNEMPSGTALGGGAQPDFDTLIDLITNTIRQQDWADNGGTIGHIKSHEGGILVDAAGAVRPIENAEESARLAAMRRDAARLNTPGGARRSSTLRKVSLSRLERELQLAHELGRPVTEEMQTLAGLRRITHVFLYPETGDIVVAGPASDWYLGRESRWLSTDDDRPVVLLDDLITLVRREFEVGGPFGCSIEPTAAGLQRVQAFMAESSKRPLAPGGLARWTKQLRDELGRQDVRVYGIDPHSRAARTLVEADYRMKLVGIDREEGTLHVPSYFDIVRDAGREPASMGLLRWWFSVNYDAVLTSSTRDAYELQGQGVLLSSEDEFLAAQGRRVSTGVADELNRRYSENFTKHFSEMAAKYPVYADLQNVFDLAVICSLMKNEALCDRAQWHRLGFADDRIAATRRASAPTSVESVANGMNLPKSRVMTVISGGVTVNCSEVARSTGLKLDDRGRLAKERQSAAPRELATHAWWWD